MTYTAPTKSAAMQARIVDAYPKWFGFDEEGMFW
jgi:hypothetical protein